MAHAQRTPPQPPAQPPSRPPMSPQVLRIRRGQLPPQRIDWSGWYLEPEDDEGQSPEHDDAINLLRNLVARHLNQRGVASRVGHDAFFAWVPDHPKVQVSPDIYIVDDAPEPLPKRFETWQPGHRPPRFALEVVSEDWRKDCVQAPQKYAQLGVRELVIFDPDSRRAPPSHKRVLFQVFRRMADGMLVQVAQGDGPVYLAEVDAWLVAIAGRRLQARLATDAAGQDLIATDAEAAGLERAEKESERTEKERERAEKERERAAKEAALASAATERQARLALEAELARLRKLSGT